MKSLIIILFSLASLAGYAQIDSASVKVNFPIQVRDAEYINYYTSFKEEYEDLFDATKVKFRVANPPNNTTVIQADSVSVGTLLRLYNFVKSDFIAVQAGIFTRVNATLRATNNQYLITRMDLAILNDTKNYLKIRELGRAISRRKP